MLRVDRIDGIAIVRVDSDVDIASASKFESYLRILRDDIVIVVDLDFCPYLDCNGFSVLHRASRTQRLIVFTSEDSKVRKLFDIVGAGEVFPLFATEAAALNAASTIAKAVE
jgi:anti-anti-sigma factor